MKTRTTENKTKALEKLKGFIQGPSTPEFLSNTTDRRYSLNTTPETTVYMTLQESLDKLDYKNAAYIHDGFELLTPEQLDKIIVQIGTKFGSMKGFRIIDNGILISNTIYYKVYKKEVK